MTTQINTNTTYASASAAAVADGFTLRTTKAPERGESVEARGLRRHFSGLTKVEDFRVFDAPGRSKPVFFIKPARPVSTGLVTREQLREFLADLSAVR